MIINILEDITGSLAKDILTQIESNEEPQITANIMSRGGDVVAGTAISDALKLSPATVTTKVFGLAASMAAAISQAGDIRLIAEDALFQPHNGAAMPIGRPTKERLQETAEMLGVVDEILLKSFNKSNLTEAALRELLIKDKPLGAQEAIKMGFFDRSINPVKAAAILNTEIMAKDESILDKLKAIKEKFTPKAVDEEIKITPPDNPPAETPPAETPPVEDAPVTRGEFESLMKLVEDLIAKMSPIDAPSVEEVVAAKLDSYMQALKSEAEIPAATVPGDPAEETPTDEAPEGGYINARQKEIQSKFN